LLQRIAVFDRLHSRAHDDYVFLYAFDLLELHEARIGGHGRSRS
jgi:hypothetical protein